MTDGPQEGSLHETCSVDELMASALRGDPLHQCTIIDLHGHIKAERTQGAFFNAPRPEDLIRTMDDIGIDLACISGVGSSEANQRMISAIEQFPDRLLGFALFNPRYPETVGEFKDLLTHPQVKGIGEIHPTSYQHRYPIDGVLYEAMWESAAELSMPILVHSGPESERALCSPSLIGKMAARYDTPVLLGHCGAYGAFPWPLMHEAIDAARQHSNVYLDLCGTARHLGVIETVVGALGDDRVTFGSDASFHSWEPEIAHVVCADLPLSSKRAILGLNAARLLNVEVEQ